MSEPDVLLFRRCRLFSFTCPASRAEEAAALPGVEWVGQPFTLRVSSPAREEPRVWVWLLAKHRTQAARLAAKLEARNLDEGRPYPISQTRAARLGLLA